MLSRIRVENVIRHVASARNLYRDSTVATQDVTEIEIPVPWGKIAGKWWGPKDQQPIVGIHGWQDNAGTFDKLVPCLPEGTSFLAIDLPGHGFSSWSPPGIPYSMLGAVLLLRRLTKRYEWRQIKLLGHSMGSMLVFLYATYFPKEIQFAIGLDIIKPPTIDVNEYADHIAKQTDNLLKTESWSSKGPSYSEEKIMHRWINGTDYSLDEAACKLLMKRGVKEVEPDEYSFTKDPRLVKFTSFDTGFTQEHILQLAERIKCPYIILKADNSPYYQKKEFVHETIETMKKSNPEFTFSMINGKHHVHLTHPERVSKLLNPFLEKYNN